MIIHVIQLLYHFILCIINIMFNIILSGKVDKFFKSKFIIDVTSYCFDKIALIIHNINYCTYYDGYFNKGFIEPILM